MAFRWGFELLGMNWVDSLSYSLHGPDVAILRDEEDDRPPLFFFTSEHFNDLEPGPALASRAGALKTIFDGAMFLLEGVGFSPERLGDLIDFQSDQRRGAFGVAPGVDPFSPSLLAAPMDARHRDRVADRLLEGALYISRSDLTVRGMLVMLGTHSVTFTSLYALRDFMNTHGMPDDQIAKAGGATKADLKLFTHTANNFAASGSAARHGDLGHQPPTTPMELAKASEIILKAARRFVSQRIKLVLPDPNGQSAATAA